AHRQGRLLVHPPPATSHAVNSRGGAGTDVSRLVSLRRPAHSPAEADRKRRSSGPGSGRRGAASAGARESKEADIEGVRLPCSTARLAQEQSTTHALALWHARSMARARRRTLPRADAQRPRLADVPRAAPHRSNAGRLALAT